MGSEWPRVTFENAPLEILDGDRGKNYPNRKEFKNIGHCVFLNTGNVTQSGFNFDSVDFISKERDILLRKGKLQREDVVLTTRGTVGNTAYFDHKIPFDHIRINSGMVLLRPKNEALEPRFLYQFVRSKLFAEQVSSLTSGSAQPQLPIRDIKRIELSLPPLPEQKRIAHILGSLDDKIELNRKMNETLEAMAQALFKSWFIDFDPVIDNALRAGNRIPEEFEERAARRRALLDQNQPSPPTPLPWGEGSDLVIDNAIRAGNPIPEEFAERTARRQALLDQNQPSPPTPLPGGEGSDSLSDSSFPNKFPPLSLGEGRGEGVPWHLFPSSFRHSEELGWIPEGWEAAKLSDLLEVKYGKDHKKLSEGNIPVYGSGGVMRHADKSLYCGESVLIPRKGTLSNILYLNEEFWTVDTMFYTIPKHEYAPKYAFHHLKGLDFTSMNVGSAVPSMTTKVLNELPMVMPDDISLRRFDEILTSYFDKSNANNKQSQYLTQLRDSLLPKLISGDLCIQDEDKVRS